MPRGSRVVVVLFTVLLSAATAAGARAAERDGPPDDPVTAARDILADARYQTELPDGCEGGCGRGGSASWPASRGGPREPGARGAGTGAAGGGLPGADLLRGLRVLLLGGGVLVLLVVVARAFRAPAPDVLAPAGPADGTAPDAPGDPPPPDDLEALVAAGRYAEAAHRLLVDTLDALGRARRVRWPGSMTAREVGHALALPTPERGELAVMVGTVERNLFGGRPVTADEWERCRRAAEALRGAPRR